jgi:dTDP-3-amino-3,4,6-trideoxy-alpha-D-glucose transaminase
MNFNCSKQRIPLADPHSDSLELRERILGAITTVIDSGSYILGKEVYSFETEVASRLGVPGAVGVGCGTDALALALLAVGVGPSDEVVTVSHTSGATVAAIKMIGAVPVFVEVRDDTCNMDPKAVDAAIGPRTKAVLPVHLYGHPADMREICADSSKRGVAVVEDCAQAQDASIDGRSVGTFGQAGAFSFYPTKTLGALGDAGLVISPDSNFIERARLLRTYGWTKPQYSELRGGICTRLDELQAAVLRVKLTRLNHDIDSRRRIAARYNEELAGLPLALPVELSGCRHVYHLYVVRCDQRRDLIEHLKRDGITTGIHYPYPVHVQPGLTENARIAGSLQKTEALAREILSLPIYPSLSSASQGRVIASVRAFFGR